MSAMYLSSNLTNLIVSHLLVVVGAANISLPSFIAVAAEEGKKMGADLTSLTFI